MGEENIFLGLSEEAKQHFIDACDKREPLALFPLLEICAFD
jgi:hypothetical protein